MPTPIACNETYMELYERTTAEHSRRKLYCGALARPLQTTSNRVFLRLWTVSVDRMPRFTLVFTAFTHGNKFTGSPLVSSPAHVVQWSNHLGAMCSRA